MSTAVSLFLTAAAALTVENFLFTGAVGFSRMLRSARKPEHRGWYALFVTLFSCVSAELSLLLPASLFPAGTSFWFRPLALALCAAAAYVLAAFLLRRFLPGFTRKHGAVLAPAAINTVVLAMPYAQRAVGANAAEALFYALGCGAAFYLGSLVLTPAYARCRHQAVPDCFQGLPASLLYIAILSLAFLGFTGGRIF